MNNKEAYTRKIDAQIDQWSARIDQLKAQANEAGADATIDYNKRIDDLKHRMDAVSKKKEELEKAASENWEKIRDQAENTLKDTREAFDRLSELVKS